MQDAKTGRYLTDAETEHVKAVASNYHRWRRQVDAEIRQRIENMMDRIGFSLFDSPPGAQSPRYSRGAAEATNRRRARNKDTQE